MKATEQKEQVTKLIGGAPRRAFAALGKVLLRRVRWLIGLRRDQRGIAGLETSVLLTAFVTASAVLSAAYMNSTMQINEKVQGVALETIDGIVAEGQTYIAQQQVAGLLGSAFSQRPALDLLSLEAALSTGLGTESPSVIELQRDGTALLSIDLSTVGLAGAGDVLADVWTALGTDAGSELPYTIETVPGEGTYLRMELESPFTIREPAPTS